MIGLDMMYVLIKVSFSGANGSLAEDMDFIFEVNVARVALVMLENSFF